MQLIDRRELRVEESPFLQSDISETDGLIVSRNVSRAVCAKRARNERNCFGWRLRDGAIVVLA